MNELALTNPLQASKAEIAEFGKRVNELAINGSIVEENGNIVRSKISAKDVLIFATRLAAYSKAMITPELRRLAAKEAELYAKGDREYIGCKMTVTETDGDPPEYDFSVVREWVALQTQVNSEIAQIEAEHAKAELLCKPMRDRIAVLEARLKEVELSSINGIADSLGEVHETAKVVKEATKSTKSVSITIK
jgi:hypothetical protein